MCPDCKKQEKDAQVLTWLLLAMVATIILMGNNYAKLEEEHKQLKAKVQDVKLP